MPNPICSSVSPAAPATAVKSTDHASLLSTLEDNAQDGCGCSYELYSHRFSALVDRAAARMTEEDATAFLALAVKHGDYATRDTIDEEKNEWRIEGVCSLTGIDPSCCPCGRHE